MSSLHCKVSKLHQNTHVRCYIVYNTVVVDVQRHWKPFTTRISCRLHLVLVCRFPCLPTWPIASQKKKYERIANHHKLSGSKQFNHLQEEERSPTIPPYTVQLQVPTNSISVYSLWLNPSNCHFCLKVVASLQRSSGTRKWVSLADTSQFAPTHLRKRNPRNKKRKKRKLTLDASKQRPGYWLPMAAENSTIAVNLRVAYMIHVLVGSKWPHVDHPVRWVNNLQRSFHSSLYEPGTCCQWPHLQSRT